MFFRIEFFPHFLELAVVIVAQQEVLKHVVEDLLEDHDNDHVVLQLVEALIPEGVHKVTDVGVHELEHVDFVDHRVFDLLHVLVVLLHHDLVRCFRVDHTEDDDEETVYD